MSIRERFLRRPDPRDATRPLDAPVRYLLAQLYCGYLVFRFHGQNNHLRKAVTLLVVIVWATLEVGAAFDLATLPGEFLYLRLFVGILLGKMWDIEFQTFADAAAPLSGGGGNADETETETESENPGDD